MNSVFVSFRCLSGVKTVVAVVTDVFFDANQRKSGLSKSSVVLHQSSYRDDHCGVVWDGQTLEISVGDHR